MGDRPLDINLSILTFRTAIILYIDSLFNLWKKPEHPVKTINLSQQSDKFIS